MNDTYYNKIIGYLQAQEEFQTVDLAEFKVNNVVKHEVIPFTNIYDKGYCVKMLVYRAGKQHVLQPVWAQSD